MAHRRRKNNNAQTVFTALVFCALLIAFIYNQINIYKARNANSADNGTREDGLVVHMIDVGQGDSFLLQCGGQNMLIDAGQRDASETVVNYLKSQNISKLDIIVGTHPHEDHIGGLDAVLDSFETGMLIMPKAQTNTKTFEDVLDAVLRNELTVTAPRVGDSYQLGSAVFTVLSPSGESYDNLNNYSVVLRGVFGDGSVLFTGDAEKEAEKEILASDMALSSTVLKVGHHGSRTSTSKEFLYAVAPKYALISCGADNSYNHPNVETVNSLIEKEVEFYRSDLSGTVVLTVYDNGSVKVEEDK